MRSFNEKPFKQLLSEFQELRRQVFIYHEKTTSVIHSFEILQDQLLEQLSKKMDDAKNELTKAEFKKSHLIKKLVLLEKIDDKYAQDEIIQELEEYSRIRRHREAQISKITREVADINLTQEEYRQVFEGKGRHSQSGKGGARDALFH